MKVSIWLPLALCLLVDIKNNSNFKCFHQGCICLCWLIVVFNHAVDFSRSRNEELICMFTGPMRALIRRVIWQRFTAHLLTYHGILSDHLPSFLFSFHSDWNSNWPPPQIANVFKCGPSHLHTYSNIRVIFAYRARFMCCVDDNQLLLDKNHLEDEGVDFINPGVNLFIWIMRWRVTVSLYSSVGIQFGGSSRWVPYNQLWSFQAGW